MKTINISFTNVDIFQELAKTTAYTGVKNESDDTGAVINRVATVEEDSCLLQRYWEMACSELIEKLKRFVTSAVSNTDSLSLTLETSGAYDDSLTPSLKTDIFSFLVASIAARWFRMVWKERAEEYCLEATAKLTEAERKLYHRKRPERKSKLK